MSQIMALRLRCSGNDQVETLRVPYIPRNQSNLGGRGYVYVTPAITMKALEVVIRTKNKY